MRPCKLFIVCLFAFVGCSDFGTELWGGWTEYELPYAQIYLPSALVRQQSGAALPENPAFAGVVDGHWIWVEFCIYTPLWGSEYPDYRQEAINLWGRPAVLFRSRGFLHVYDSHFSLMVGVKAYFKPDGGAVVVVVVIRDEGADPLAREILMTLHPAR